MRRVALGSDHPPKQADVVLMVPLHNGQQVLAVLQGQLTDVLQALLIEGAQNRPPVAGHRWFLGLQGGVEAGVTQVRHWQRGHHHCTHTRCPLSSTVNSGVPSLIAI